MKKEYITKNAEDTQRVGEEFAKQLSGEEIICLYGNLGFGKTTFVQGFAQGLGIRHRIISPTFIIVRNYKVPITNEQEYIQRLYHIDLYRIETVDNIKSLGLSEMLQDKEAIAIIEWPERLGDSLPKKRWDVKFDYRGENERKITIVRIDFGKKRDE